MDTATLLRSETSPVHVLGKDLSNPSAAQFEAGEFNDTSTLQPLEHQQSYRTTHTTTICSSS